MSKKILTAVIAGASLIAGGAASADNGATTVGGKAYVDMTNINQTSDGKDAAAKGTGVDVKRLYLNFSHSFDKVWSVNATTDFNYSSSTGETQLFVKKANIQASLADAFTARLGAADMPWIPFDEDIYGYRYVENTIIDRLHFGNSADWGLHTLGKFAGGKFNYAVSAVNGNGYKNPTRSKSIDVEGRFAYMPVSGLTIAAGFYSGKLGKDIANSTTVVHHTTDRFDALIGYVSPQFRLGAEYFTATNWYQVTAVPTDKSDGYSVWGSYNFRPNLSVFARADQAKPKKDLSPGLKDTYFNAGIAYTPVKNVDVAFAYKHEKMQNGSFGTTNGTIGGVNEGKYDEVGVWAQASF